MPNKLNINDIREVALKKYGLKLISENYVNATEKLLWETSKGEIFERCWHDINRGKLTPRNMNSYSFDKHIVESYKDLGYKLDMSVDEYNKSIRSGTNRVFCIVHKELPNKWYTTLPNFKRNAVTYLNQTKKSTGEVIIESILNNNNINFIYQYRVEINNKLHIIDFYVPDFNTFIEYDGEQHFIPVKSWGGEDKLDKQIILDNEKDRYARRIHKNMLRIPYTKKSQDEIIDLLEICFNKRLAKGNIKVKSIVKEVALYYNDHSLGETSIKYLLSPNTISSYYYKFYGEHKKVHRVNRVKVYDTLTRTTRVYKSVKETSLRLKIPKSSVYKMCRGIKTSNCRFDIKYLN